MGEQRYRVRVAKEYLSFSAAHFISLAGSRCERLHGHNYRVAVEVEADLTEDGLVIDFALLKRIVRRITDELDHRVLLPAAGEQTSITDEDPLVLVQVKDRQWAFPGADCVFLPISSTTAELLANWMANRLQAELREQAGTMPKIIRLEVEESPGQSAICEFACEA